LSDLIVAIDGPGGTGKSSVSRELARRAGLPHLDTGAFYRAATLAALEAGVDLDDGDAVTTVVEGSDFSQEEGRMYLDGRDVSDPIREDEITKGVSAVSAHPAVRAHLVELQRSWLRSHEGRGVVEGRDIGSVVFPDATVKVYLDASPEVRARRRAEQSGEDIAEVLEDLNRRDHLDSTRVASPMTVPRGAIVVDTSELDFEAVVEQLIGLLPSES